jgi:hypothetical protein
MFAQQQIIGVQCFGILAWTREDCTALNALDAPPPRFVASNQAGKSVLTIMNDCCCSGNSVLPEGGGVEAPRGGRQQPGGAGPDADPPGASPCWPEAPPGGGCWHPPRAAWNAALHGDCPPRGHPGKVTRSSHWGGGGSTGAHGNPCPHMFRRHAAGLGRFCCCCCCCCWR